MLTINTVGPTIMDFGTEEHKDCYLPRILKGENFFCIGYTEPGAGTDLAALKTRAVRDGDEYVINGQKIFTSLAGASGQREARLELNGATVAAGDVLGDPHSGAEIVNSLVERATAATCVVAAGVCQQALEMTAICTKTREQFDRPIASFQAVGQRAADAYIDAEAVRLTAWQAAWRLDAGLPASAEVAVDKFWAADGGQRVVHAAQHLHGGIGVDRDYPLHRYFQWAKHLELTLGGGVAPVGPPRPPFSPARR